MKIIFVLFNLLNFFVFKLLMYNFCKYYISSVIICCFVSYLLEFQIRSFSRVVWNFNTLEVFSVFMPCVKFLLHIRYVQVNLKCFAKSPFFSSFFWVNYLNIFVQKFVNAEFMSFLKCCISCTCKTPAFLWASVFSIDCNFSCY